MNKPSEDALFIRNTAKEHTSWLEHSLPMIASENVISPLAREMLITDFADRYAEGWPGRRYYQGCIYIDKVEERTIALAKKLFKANYADVRPISGTVSNIGVLFALTKPGETITAVDTPSGGHISHAVYGAVGVRGLNVVKYPFDQKNMNIDVDAASKVIRETKPKLCLFGQSVYLFPTPIKELMPAIQEVGAYVMYDAAHVLGLIAGGQFQDPLREGADVMTGSTHKTLPGPQHGIVLSDRKKEESERSKKILKKLDFGIFPGVVSNHHLAAVASLGVALSEHINFGTDYAAQIVKNAKALGQALHEKGINVIAEHLGFTKSHTLVMDVSKLGSATKFVEQLEQANIITNKNLLPWDDVNTAMDNPSGIRVGVQELTRIGMKESEMKQVAELFKKILVDKKAPAEVKKDVIALKKGFEKIHYCFYDGTEAYKYYELV